MRAGQIRTLQSTALHWAGGKKIRCDSRCQLIWPTKPVFTSMRTCHATTVTIACFFSLQKTSFAMGPNRFKCVVDMIHRHGQYRKGGSHQAAFFGRHEMQPGTSLGLLLLALEGSSFFLAGEYQYAIT